MLKVKNTRVYGLEESIIASGYPMMVNTPDEDEFNNLSNRLEDEYFGSIIDDTPLPEDCKKHFKRAGKLFNTKLGSGHACASKGIIVQCDITYPQYWSLQWQRYHFSDIVSSTSKMHRITKMPIKDCCNKYVDDVVVENLNGWIDIYNHWNEYEVDELTKKQVFMKIISNTPMGLEMTMRVTNNYLQLQSQYYQRMNHKLEDWWRYCAWAESLPMFVEFMLNGERKFTNEHAEPLKPKYDWRE